MIPRRTKPSRSIALALGLACFTAAIASVSAQQPEPTASSAAPSPSPEATQRAVVTHHTVQIGATQVRYAATAGTLLLYDAKNQPTASVFYHAYVAEGLGSSARRPLTFAYNGGPGAASALVDIGAFGPRTVLTANAVQTPPPPYEMVDNANSILDRTDLVFIDAVGSGFSRLVGSGTAKDYYGVDEDGKAFTQFIRRYITLNDRWNSPKYLIGESYGTTRSAVLAKMLQGAGIAVSGVTLMSTVLDYALIGGETGDDEPYVSYLPTEAAVAAYYHKIPVPPAGLEAFLRDVRAYASGPYAQALIAGDALPSADRQRVAQQLREYTGLSLDYILRSDLRIPPGRFRKVLLGADDETVGRYDARFRGFDIDPLGADADSDPSSDATSSAFIAAFNGYVRNELGYRTGEEYVFLSNDVNRQWNWNRGGHSSPVAVQVIDDLAQAMTANRYLRVLSVNGLYDMATPFFGTEQSLHHLGIASQLQSNVTFRYYRSGHMIYLNPLSHATLHADLEAFYAATSR
ncbi:MAG: S10 family peptidase [Vulcanimicrobiaceae bacterium]